MMLVQGVMSTFTCLQVTIDSLASRGGVNGMDAVQHEQGDKDVMPPAVRTGMEQGAVLSVSAH
jgi:hypothetical protein